MGTKEGLQCLSQALNFLIEAEREFAVSIEHPLYGVLKGVIDQVHEIRYHAEEIQRWQA